MNLSDALGDNQQSGAPWPGQPTNPTWPGQPTNPTWPGQPSNPTWPGQPAGPGGQPSNPTWPGQPSNPTWPGQPTGPGGQPSNPTWPGQPTGPGGQPSNPSWPGGPSPQPAVGPGSGPGPRAPPLTVPYNRHLNDGIYDRLLITIVGTIKPNPKMFTVDICTAHDIALHLNPRFNDQGHKTFVRNSCIGTKWGNEERELPHFPFVPGQRFEMKIMCTSREFKVAVNNTHMFSFQHRISNLRSINKFNIYNDVTLSDVRLETV